MLATDASTPSNQLMTTMHVPKITVTPQLESSITMQSPVMTTIHAQLILAMLQKDVNTLQSILQQRMQQALTNAKFGSVPLTKDSILKMLTVMTLMHAQLTLAIQHLDNALILQSAVMTLMHVLMILAMQLMDALTPITFVTMEMHVL
jgi:hypothetical protein